jgi:hypothetical protein
VNVAEGTIETRKRQFVFYTPIFCIQSTNIGLPEYSLLLLPFSDMGPRAHGLFLGQAGFLRKPGRAQARGPLAGFLTEHSAVIFVFSFLPEYASHLDDEWIFEAFCWPERLTLVQLNVELGSRKSKRQLAQFPALIEIEDVLLRDIISVDRVHNTEFRLHIKPTNIVLIFETAKVESRPGQLADTKLGQIRS